MFLLLVLEQVIEEEEEGEETSDLENEAANLYNLKRHSHPGEGTSSTVSRSANCSDDGSSREAPSRASPTW